MYKERDFSQLHFPVYARHKRGDTECVAFWKEKSTWLVAVVDYLKGAINAKSLWNSHKSERLK